MKYDNDNVFARIVRGEIPSDKVYEDEDILAFRDINPQTPVHIVIIPKETDICLLGECEDKDAMILGKMSIAAAKIARQEGLECFRTIVNSGAGAGQTIFHVHMHLLGGREFTESII